MGTQAAPQVEAAPEVAPLSDDDLAAMAEALEGYDPTAHCDYCDKRGVRAYPCATSDLDYLVCDSCAERDGLR